MVHVFLSFFFPWQPDPKCVKNVGVSAGPKPQASSLHSIQRATSQDQTMPRGAAFGNDLRSDKNLPVFLSVDVREDYSKNGRTLQSDRGAIGKAHDHFFLGPILQLSNGELGRARVDIVLDGCLYCPDQQLLCHGIATGTAI